MKACLCLIVLCALAVSAAAAIVADPGQAVDTNNPFHNLSEIGSPLAGQSLRKLDSTGNGIVDYADIAGGLQSGGVSVEIQGGSQDRVAKYVANNVIGQSFTMTEAANGRVAIGTISNDYAPGGGNWNYDLLLHGNDMTSIGFHDAGHSVGSIRYQGRQFYIGYDDGWGNANLWVGGTINGVQYHGPYGGSTAGSYYHLGSWGGNGWGPDVLVERARYSDTTYGGNRFSDWPDYADSAGELAGSPACRANGANCYDYGDRITWRDDVGRLQIDGGGNNAAVGFADIASGAYRLKSARDYFGHWLEVTEVDGGNYDWLKLKRSDGAVFDLVRVGFASAAGSSTEGGNAYIYTHDCDVSGTASASTVCASHGKKCLGASDPKGAVGFISCSTVKGCVFWNDRDGAALCYN